MKKLRRAPESNEFITWIATCFPFSSNKIKTAILFLFLTLRASLVQCIVGGIFVFMNKQSICFVILVYTLAVAPHLHLFIYYIHFYFIFFSHEL